MINLPWLELEALARDVANLEDRLRAARSTHKHELAERLEQELEAATARRPRLLDALARQGAASTTSPGWTEPETAATCEWDRLTPADLDQAKHALACRRIAILTRHAEELQALEAERRAIDALERTSPSFRGMSGSAQAAAP